MGLSIFNPLLFYKDIKHNAIKREKEMKISILFTHCLSYLRSLMFLFVNFPDLYSIAEEENKNQSSENK